MICSRLWSKKYPICLVITCKNKSALDLASIDSSTATSQTSDEETIYLFARTGREKEHWFRLLKNAANVSISVEVSVESLQHKRSSSSDSCHSILHTPQLTLQDFQSHMLSLVSISSEDFKSTPSEKFTLPYDISWNEPVDALMNPPKAIQELCEFDATWMNAFIGRGLWDFMTEESWSKMIADKIQKKLSKIKVNGGFGISAL